MNFPIPVLRCNLTGMNTIEKIVRLCEDKGITQVSLERSAGLSANKISKWKDGKGEPKAREAFEIARRLGVSVEYLLDDSMDGPPLPRSAGDDLVLLLIRSLGLGHDEALRRLATPPPSSAAGPAPYGSEAPPEDARTRQGRRA